MSNEESREETPVSKEIQQKKSQKSVMNYLFVLFAAAFCLLVLTLLMEQRTNDEIVGTLSDQVKHAQTSYSDIAKQRDELRVALAEAEKQMDALQDALDAMTIEHEYEITLLEDDLSTAENHIAELELTLNGLDSSNDSEPID